MLVPKYLYRNPCKAKVYNVQAHEPDSGASPDSLNPRVNPSEPCGERL